MDVLENTLPMSKSSIIIKHLKLMKKLLLLFFLAFALTYVVQAIPAPDRDVGSVTYVMPTFQIDQHFAVATLPTMQTLYLDTGRANVSTLQPEAYKQSQVIRSVRPVYKGPWTASQVIDPIQYRQAYFT